MSKFQLILPLLFLCQVAQAGSEFSFLRGCWQSTTSSKTIEECWGSTEGNQVLGMIKTVVKGKVESLTFLRIQKIGFEFWLTPYFDGKEVPALKLKSLSSTSASFVNTEVDYPQVINYSVIDQTISVSSEGTVQGAPVYLEYKLRKSIRH